MRRSSRRRVIPRLSSSASRGTACLRVIPAASRNSLTVNPAGRLASRAAARAAAVPTASACHHRPSRSTRTPRRTSSRSWARLDARPARRAPARRRPGRRRRGGRRAGRARRRRRAVDPVTTTSSSVVEQGAVALVERRHVEPSGAGGVERSASAPRRRTRRRSTTQRPTVGCAPLAGQRARARRRRPSPARRRPGPTDRSGRAFDAGQDRGDVEHLAAADRLVAARLPQHVAVAGQQRQGGRQVQPDRDRGRRAAIDVRPEHADAHRVLAGADVGEVGAAPRHRRGRAPSRTCSEASTRRVGAPAVRRARRRRPARSSRVVDAGEVERDAVAGPDARRPTGPSVWIAADPAARRRAARRAARRRRASAPPVSVPVTTVPLPLAANTRSTHSRAGPGRAPPASCGRARSRARRQLVEPVAERRDDGHDRRAGEERAGQVVGDLQRGQLDELGRRAGRPWSGRRRRGGRRAARGSAGAPRTAASSPRWRPPRTGRRRRRRRRRACSAGTGRGRARRRS